MKFSEQVEHFIAHHKAANVQTVSLVFLEERLPEIVALESENAELNKFLKHARDDKKIRLGEIEGLEAKIVELRKERDTYGALGYRMSKSIIAGLENDDADANENPQT